MVVELDLVAAHADRVVLAFEAVAMDALLLQRADDKEVHLERYLLCELNWRTPALMSYSDE